MSGPLEGLKVLEVANWVAGPSACAIMADMGAEVVKIEHPETGDPVRSVEISELGVVQYTGGINKVFELLNRGKHSVAVNLEIPQGQEIVQKLAAQSDVVITNLTPNRQERYKLRYEDLSALNPRMIYLVLTGYGTEGPERDRSGFDYAAFWADQRSQVAVAVGRARIEPVSTGSQSCPARSSRRPGPHACPHRRYAPA